MIIDVHSHVILDNPASRNYQFPGEPHRPIPARTFVRHALSQPVDVMVLSADPSWTRTAHGLERANARVAEIVRKHPRRFAGLCEVNPLLGRASIDQMETHIRAGNLCGIGEICPYLLKYDSGDRREYPIIEKAIELDTTILYHSSVKKDSDAVDRLATDFPKARFVMAHMGGMFNWQFGIEVAARHDNVWVDTSGFVMLCYGAMPRAFGLLGASKILFGVDFPLINAAPLVTALREMRLARGDYERIAWRNAAELFKIDVRRAGRAK